MCTTAAVSYTHLTKKLVVNPDEAANIRLMFEMYAQPTTSYGDITRYFAEQGILFNGKELIRPTLAQMLRNPVYVQADLDAVSYTHLYAYGACVSET